LGMLPSLNQPGPPAREATDYRLYRRAAKQVFEVAATDGLGTESPLGIVHVALDGRNDNSTMCLELLP